MDLKNKIDIDLLMFVYKYMYLDTNNLKYLFSSKYYYKKRVTYLIENKFLRKTQNCLVLGKMGIQYIKNMGYSYTQLFYNKEYVARQKIISTIAAFFYQNEIIHFTPSVDLKDKAELTICSRRFIGMLEIDSKKYLTYYLSKEHNQKYESSIYFDIQKEKKYRNILILIEDITKIEIEKYYFDLNEVLIIPDFINDSKLLANIHNIDWHCVIKKLYPGESICICKYKFADYIVNTNKLVNTFMFVDTEKINSIKLALIEYKAENFYIVCSEHIESSIKKELPNVNYRPICIQNYMKEQVKYE